MIRSDDRELFEDDEQFIAANNMEQSLSESEMREGAQWRRYSEALISSKMRLKKSTKKLRSKGLL